MPLKNYRWFIEYFSAEEGHLHGIRRVLYSKQTPFQSVDILELGSYGKALVLDGRIHSKRYGEAFLGSLPECTLQKVTARQMPGLVAGWLGDGA